MGLRGMQRPTTKANEKWRENSREGSESKCARVTKISFDVRTADSMTNSSAALKKLKNMRCKVILLTPLMSKVEASAKVEVKTAATAELVSGDADHIIREMSFRVDSRICKAHRKNRFHELK